MRPQETRSCPSQLSPFTRFTAPLFILFLSFSTAIEVSCWSGHVVRSDSNSLFLVRGWSSTKRNGSWNITRHGNICPRTQLFLWSGPEKIACSSPKGQDGPRTRRCNVISFRYPLSTDRTRIFAPSLAPRHFHPLSRPLSFLYGPVIPYVWHTVSSSSKRDECSFGIRHWPLATFLADLALSWDLA